MIEKANCVDSNFYKGMDNHGQSPLAMIVQRDSVEAHNMASRSSKNGNGGTGHLSKQDGKSYCHDTATLQCVAHVGRKLNGNGKRVDEGKTGAITTVGKDNMVKAQTRDKIRRLTPVEVCRLFTLPDDYFFHNGKPIVSESQQYRLMGNGWVVDVIAHIFSHLPEHLK